VLKILVVPNFVDELLRDKQSDPTTLKVGDLVYDPNFGFDTVSRVIEVGFDPHHPHPGTRRAIRLDMDAGTIWRDMDSFRPLSRAMLENFARNAGMNLKVALDTHQRFQHYLLGR
jgi:hypothetical protein